LAGQRRPRCRRRRNWHAGAIWRLYTTIGANLDKVVSCGKRADSIVKTMLLHSHEGSGERSSVNVNAIVEEALNLAYHGARAEKSGFNVTIGKSLDPDAGSADLYPQEVTRALLNLISNGFYATTKPKQGRRRNLRADGRRLDPRSRRFRRNRHPRQRDRNSGGHEGENVQSVLHHQARRGGNWTRAFAQP
jgi:signal transduction histidine kinase